MAGPKSATEIMMLHDAARLVATPQVRTNTRRRDVAIAAYCGTEAEQQQFRNKRRMIIIENMMAAKGPDMSKFTEWLMEMYPKTEDYVYIRGTFETQTQSYRELYLRIKPDPRAFLEQMKEFDEQMKED